MAIGAKYRSSCINCNGTNTDKRNEKGLPCYICLPYENAENIYFALKRHNTLKNYLFYHTFYSKYRTFDKFFKEVFGSPLTGYQRLWTRRLVLSRSFTIIAPTGVGKTTFGLIVSLYLAKNKKKVALIFPTVSLVKQSEERLHEFLKNLKEDNIKILSYTSGMKEKEKEEFERDFSENNFDILIVSSQFISKRRQELSKKFFSLVFVDDVDAVLKSSKNVDTLLQMIGIPEPVIKKTYMNLVNGKKNNNINLQKKLGVLIVSSATARPRGLKPLLFRELLGFDIGRFVFTIRNITNIRIKSRDRRKLLKIIKSLRDGILIFVDNEKEGVKLTSYLEKKGLKVGKTWENFEEYFEQFKNGKIGIFCGVFSYYGKIVRGIDLPERIKYAIFWGVPSFKYSINIEKAPKFILERVLKEFSQKQKQLSSIIENMEKMDTEKIRKLVSKYIGQEKFKEMVERLYSNVKISDNTLIFPDVYTYIQGSGRTSRMLGSKLTKGISIVFEKDDTIFESLRSRLVFLTEEDWVQEEDIHWEKIKAEVEESRKKQPQQEDISKSTLMIVESPTKADTISKFLGRCSTRRYGNLLVYESITSTGILLITATVGHLYDLETKSGIYGVEYRKEKFIPVYNSIKRCENCNYQFTDDFENCPKCGKDKILDKKETLQRLREIALETDRVLVATDPDVEGEKISWDVTQYILPVNKNVERVEMHEITRYGFYQAEENKRKTFENLVKAQIVRRIEDRWVGFGLSTKLQKNFNSPYLSAGRVQSTVLGWIVEREKEYLKSEKVFTAITLENNYPVEIEGEVECEKIGVEVLDEYEEELSSLPPFITSTLLSEISRKLGFGAKESMEILQDLFENGFITYHRTDSTRISFTGQNIAKTYLEKIGKGELFLGRNWSDKGAHEAIRPVKPLSPEDLENFVSERLTQDITLKHIKVYAIIFNRFIASQMKNPVVLKQKVKLRFDGKEMEVDVPFSVKEKGWIDFNPVKIYTPFKNGEYKVISSRVYHKHTVPLFTQATIIEEMKKKGIGRPSTYAKIVDILFERGYIVEDQFRRIKPTNLGKKVYEFLQRKYHNYITEEATRQLEDLMELVEKEEKDYQEVLKLLNAEFKKIVYTS